MSESEIDTLRRRVAALEAEVAHLRAQPAGQGTREAELRLITDALPILVAYVDRDYRYRFNNRHYETWFGQGVEALTGLHVRAVLGPDVFAQRQPFMEQALAGETVAVDGVLPDRDGRLRACAIQYIPRRDAAGTVEGFFVLAIDVDERRAAESRRIAVAELGDRLRDLDDTAEIAFAASEILGTTLGVSRAGYGTIDPVAETILIERDWNAPGIRSLAGTLHFRDYGSYIEDLKRGETVICADATEDSRTASGAEALKAISAQSFVNMPLTEHGGFVALLYLNHATARSWSSEELAFMRNVAERVRAAPGRRRPPAGWLRALRRRRNAAMSPSAPLR